MKKSKKPRVSWPQGPMLCQVKMFRTEDCPAKVASQPQRQSYLKQLSGKPRAPDLPPGFERNNYVVKLNVSNIPLIKWKRPPQFSVNNTWLVGGGGESTERRTENLRISKVLEAIYPHRSAIPSRPSVSPVVEAESFDDNKTPVIRLTPIEDEWETTEKQSRTMEESWFTANKEGPQLETKPLCSTQELISGIAPDLSMAASAALTALMKTNELGSMVDHDLLIKLLSNPEMIKNMISDTSGKSSETKYQPGDANINSTRLVPQPFIPSPIAHEQSFAASQPLTNPDQRPVSQTKPGNGNISPQKPINGNISPQKQINGNLSPQKPINGKPCNTAMPLHSYVCIAKEHPRPSQFPSTSLPINLNLQRPQNDLSAARVVAKPQTELQPNSAYYTSEMNNSQASVGLGRGSQTGLNSHPMNLNQAGDIDRPKPVVQPTKSLDYFKNLIREHGTDNPETNRYHLQNGIYNGKNKIKKQCIYFGTASGCKLGDNCSYIHDRCRPNFGAETPRAKRLKFGRYGKRGFST